MKKTEKKQFKELSEEELKDVTGGGYSKGEFTCPDGRTVFSFSQCDVLAALEVMQVNHVVLEVVKETYAALEVGVQGMTALGD